MDVRPTLNQRRLVFAGLYIIYARKWNEWGFRPPLCTNRLNWARRTSWGWWDDWDDTVLKTQDLKFEPWRSEAEHATARSRRLPTILNFTRGWGRNTFVSFKPPRPGTEPRTLAWGAAVLTTSLGPPPVYAWKSILLDFVLKSLFILIRLFKIGHMVHTSPHWDERVYIIHESK